MHRNVRLATPPRAGSSRGRSVIAVIGIDRYPVWPRLHNAVNDALGAARMFTRLGFAEVAGPLLDEAATGEAIRRMIRTDLARLAADDSLVVFFAGHGHTDTAAFHDVAVKTGYLIPADGEGPGGDGRATWLRLDGWLSDIARLPPRHILVVIDACHSGVALSAIHRWRGDAVALGAPGLDALQARRSRCVITSALDDQRATDGGPYPGHSLFTGCLIEGLSGGLAGDGRRVATGREIGQYLQRRVRSYPHTTQTPDFGAFELDDRGDIVVPILDPEAAPDSAPRPPPEQRPGPAHRPRRALIAAAGVVGAAGAGLVLRSALARDHGAPPREAAFEIPAIEVQAAVRAPRGLTEPWVLEVHWPPFDHHVDALDRQRRVVARAGDPAQKRAQAVVLAAMLYRDAPHAMSGAPAMLAEARQLLRDLAGGPGDGLDEAALRLLAACDLRLADYPAAEQTWRTLVERYPESKDEPSHRAWLVHALLMQGRNADALAAAAAERRDDRHPELAYFAAWARWRSRDAAGAWQSLVTAAQRWDEAEMPCRDARRACINGTWYSPPGTLERDMRWLAGLADVPLDRADAVLSGRSAASGGLSERWAHYGQLQALGLRYGLAGRWTSAVAALDRAAAVGGDLPPAAERIALRTAQAELAVRLDTPELVAKYAGEAVDAFPLCDTAAPDRAAAESHDGSHQRHGERSASEWDAERRASCVREKVDAVQRLHALARMFYGLHQIASDPRYPQSARDLYAMVIPLVDNGATRARAQAEMTALQAARADRTSDAGGRGGAALGELLARHNEEIATCYEASLAASPALAGTLGLRLELDATGAVTGVATEPAAGAADLPAVAGCVAAQARRWKLFGLGAGRTRIALRYALSVKQAQD